MAKVVVRYVPAHHKQNLSRESKNQAMDKFMLSHQMQEAALDATEDIARAAAADAMAAGLVRSGGYVQGFEAEIIRPVIVDGNPRAAAQVKNDVAHAAAMEWGNSKVQGLHILYRAGAPYHTPKGIA